jgi:tetratricopeptide (TPR) repeat protein
LTQALEYEVALSERYPALTRANWERMIAEAYYGLGKTQPALQHLTNALQILDLPAPRNKSGLLFNVAVSILQRIWSHFSRRTLPPSQIIPATTIHERTSLQGARIYDQLAALYFFANDNLRLVHSVLQAVNLTESLGPSAGLARGYASVCVAAGTIPIHFIAQNYSRMAIETARLINQPSALAHAMLYTNIYSIGIGEWAKTIPENQEAAKVFKDLGDHYRLGETQTGLGLAHYFQGDFAQSLSTFKLVEENASRSNNTLQLAWGLGGMAMAKVRLGFPDDGIQLAQRTLQALEIAIDQSEEIRAYAAMEWGMFNKGDWQAALEIYHTLQSTINGKVSPVYSVMEGYAIQVLLPLAIWEAWVDPERAYLNNVINRPGSQGEWKNEAQKALQVFHKFAGVFPIGKARVLLYQGLFDWLYGQVQSAYTNWMESLQIARRMEMPYEEGLACLELGRHTIGEAQKEFLEFGARIFERCNAAFELELIQTLLSNQQDSSI